MRKVILFMHVSLDGFTEGLNGAMDWIVVDDEVWEDVIKLQNTADTALFGRVNYQGFASYWPTVASDSASTEHEIEHANWLNQSLKIVFSATLKTIDWANSRIVHENIVDEITKLKQQPGKNLLLFGGAGIARTFLALGAIDEFRLNVDPVVIGGAKPLFKDIHDRIDLNLLETKIFRSGVVGLHYEVRQR
jgi:dihydrofolate reductase